MFPHLRARIQFLILAALLLPATTFAQLEDEDGFRSVGDFPWVGWYGPISDGLHGLRFGTDGFEVNRVMREKGLQPSHARDYTLRFGGDVLGEPAEIVTWFTTERPSAPGSALRVVQIRWVMRGLPSQSMKLFGRLDAMLLARYGDPVHAKDEPVSKLENGAGRTERLYYGTSARAWLELSGQASQEYALLIRIECPQLPDPEEDES